MECYDVKFENQTVGSVFTEKEGLYYRFCCQCKLSKSAVCRLVVSCNGRTTDIGICVPQADGFGLEKRIPAKKIGEGQMQFEILPCNQVAPMAKIQVDPSSPFKYISELQNGFLRINDGCYEIVLAPESTKNLR